jgi:hypothetical protein
MSDRVKARHPREKSPATRRQRAWEDFRDDQELRRIYNIKPQEIVSLSRAAMLGNLASKQDFIFMLKMIRGRTLRKPHRAPSEAGAPAAHPVPRIAAQSERGR